MQMRSNGGKIAALHAHFLRDLDVSLQRYFDAQIQAIRAQHADVLRKLARKLQTLRSEFARDEPQRFMALSKLGKQVQSPDNKDLVGRMLKIWQDIKNAQSTVSDKNEALRVACRLQRPEQHQHAVNHSEMQHHLAAQCAALVCEIDRKAQDKRPKFSLSRTPQ